MGQIVDYLFLQLLSKAFWYLHGLFCRTYNAYDTYICCCWPPSMMETVWKFFGCCFCFLVDWLREWFTNNFFLLDESCFKLSISFWCLICLLNPSSLVWILDELDRDGGFPLLLLMVSAFSCSIVVLCWVVVWYYCLAWLSSYVGFTSLAF